MSSAKMTQKTFNEIVGRAPLPGVGVPPPKFDCQLPPRLPSRLSRSGLPCPEIWDTHEPEDENDMRGFIKVMPRVRREARRQKKWVVLP
jgi:hypothetical protein